jgi:hypothetical protein
MAATNTAFIFFQSFVKRLGDNLIDLSASAAIPTRFFAKLHSSTAGLTPATDASTITSITGEVLAILGSNRRFLTNCTWTALSAPEVSAFVWDSDQLVFTASNTATVKFCVFYMSTGANTGYPIGYIGLVAADTEVTSGNTITITPNTYWFSMSR